jgi:hypothetical protein
VRHGDSLPRHRRRSPLWQSTTASSATPGSGPASPTQHIFAKKLVSEKRRKAEAHNLAFQSPGRGFQSVAEPALMEAGVRTTRSGKRIELPSAEQIEREVGVLTGGGAQHE